jgi:hypothetical protein
VREREREREKKYSCLMFGHSGAKDLFLFLGRRRARDIERINY